MKQKVIYLNYAHFQAKMMSKYVSERMKVLPIKIGNKQMTCSGRIMKMTPAVAKMEIENQNSSKL